ncbi:MAG: GAF domain-containing protein [Deltaproteobacteria bacterium]|nr:GAF domain-containing protein [Deltaproteobacteria bacterium]MBN2846252.1 GAF domain-containing protein [Deltaproteobacteria bacterium]
MGQKSTAIRGTKELSLLWEVSRVLEEGRDVRKIGIPILRALDKYMGMSRGFITLLNRQTGEIFIEAGHGLSKAQKERGKYKIGEGVVGRVVETGRPMIVPKISDEPLFLDRTGVRKNLPKKDISFICVPIRNQQEVIGTLSADRLFDESVSLKEDLRLLTIIASMIAQAVRILQQEEEERQIALREEERAQRKSYISSQPVSTGHESLDAIINSLRAGDNVVWQVDNLDDYRYVVQLFVEKALEDNRKLIYIRFADHEPLVKPEQKAVTYHLNPASGFETFSTEVYDIITKEGLGAYYVFDCLSNLLSEWSTDLMVGNFFLITCPYLFELDTIAYFAVIRGSHSFQTIARIRETTQVLLDIYNDKGDIYIHPLKVWKRYSPTMFLPHKKEGDAFVPIIDSVDAAKLFSDMSKMRKERGEGSLDYWDKLFIEAESLLEKPWESEKEEDMIERICRIMITREPRMTILVKDNFSLDDLLRIRERLIGTGFLGGKTGGMLLARKILELDKNSDWKSLLEEHDSFYIGSDVFYTYLVQNNWWKLRMEQKTKEGYFKAGRILRDRMKQGHFPDEVKEQFYRMLEYFGQSPIIVRSSSLLEDSFGNAFAGKYESIFLVNQGTPEERYAQFENAVRTIYASAMNEDALTYRMQRGLERADEQMALLVQRVSGSHHKNYYFPDLAGVGISYNTFVWNKEMDPKAGMLRLVFGLGTRAVNRVEGDYPRIVALDLPLLKPHAGMEDTRKFSQRDVDLLDLEHNDLKTKSVLTLSGEGLDIRMDRIGVRDYETDQRIRELGIKGQEAWVLTFDDFFSGTQFTDIMRRMLKKLQTIYEYPVDIEFTVNFTDEDDFKINLVQCRPLQVQGEGKRVEFPKNIEKDNILFQFEGNFFGGGILESVDRIIYVDPLHYTKLSLQEKYEIARLVGRLNRQIENREECHAMLLGPGRWGSTTPSLGVPVGFSEINNISVLGEIAYSDGNLMPELSYGTHFFQDLVETGIFYIAIFPGEKGVTFNILWLEKFPNQLEEYAPDFAKYRNVVKVFDSSDENLKILADVVKRKVICYQ